MAPTVSLILVLHFSGQVTCERIVALLNGMGVKISKRQVVRLLTAKLETFRAEDEAVLKAGLGGAYVTVDDTGARHAGKSGYTTQIGSGTFTLFRTGPSKSRQAFLSRLCGGTALYVINDAALGYMKDRRLPSGRHRHVRGSQGTCFLSPRGLGAAFAGAGPDRPESRSGSCPDRQRRRAVGRDPASRAVAGHRHRFR